MNDYALQIVKTGDSFVWILFKDGKGDQHGSAASVDGCVSAALSGLGAVERVLAQVSVGAARSS